MANVSTRTRNFFDRVHQPNLPMISGRSAGELENSCGRGCINGKSTRIQRYLPSRPSRSKRLNQIISPHVRIPSPPEFKCPESYIPKLCDRLVPYQSPQYSATGWPNVSSTKMNQKKAMAFLRVCSEYGKGGGSVWTGTTAASGSSICVAMGGGPRDLDGSKFQGLRVVMGFVTAIQRGFYLGHGEGVR